MLAGFFGLTGAVLDEAFRASGENALRDRLLGHVYALLAAADEDEQGGIRLPEALPDPRFNQPESGLYADVRSTDTRYRWLSPSTLGGRPDFFGDVDPGRREYIRTESDNGKTLFVLRLGVVWETNGGDRSYTFAVAEDLRPLLAQQRAFRVTLWKWLAGVALVLLAIQGLVLRWGLSPLRRVAAELQRIEEGGARELQGRYPRELRGLTDRINSLIRHSEARQTRFRDSLGDLAHSMKTPLAILQGAVDAKPSAPSNLSDTVAEQVVRMNEIVQHQLQRAATSGRSTLAGAVSVATVTERIVRSLEKVYPDKTVAFRSNITEGHMFQGDEADLMELLGNLLDNAWKHCRSRIHVATNFTRQGLNIRVDDDGAGIPEELREEVVRRGQRADMRYPGQGIGLTVAKDIAEAYGGRLGIGQSNLGGLSVELRFPAAGPA